MSEGWNTTAEAPAGLPPGWYPDPWYPGAVRYWDGRQWTLHTQVTMAGPKPLDLAAARKTSDRAAIAFAVQGACQAATALLYPLAFGGFFESIRRSSDTGETATGFPGGASTALGLGAIQLVGIVSLVCLVLILIWAYQATTTARALGRPTTHSPGMAVGAWLIPVVNFWFPYQVVRDLVPEGHRARPLVKQWWILYLVQSVGLIAVFVLTLAGGRGAGLIGGAMVGIVAVVAGLSARRVVDAVAEVQDNETERLMGAAGR